MNRYGASGLGGYDPGAVVAYLDTRIGTRVTQAGQQKRTLNGLDLRPDDARTIRRWRKASKSVSQKGLNRLFEDYDMTIPAFKTWAKRHGYGSQPRLLTNKG
jgi:hypothetical protein